MTKKLPEFLKAMAPKSQSGHRWGPRPAIARDATLSERWPGSGNDGGTTIK
jgi:hypothetical protein